MAAQSAPDEVLDILLMVGDSCWKAKELEPSRRAYEWALTFEPGNTEALNRLGRIALVNKFPHRAETYFAAANRVKAEAATFVNLAVALGRQEEFAAALRNCHYAIELDPDFLPAHIHLAALLDDMGQPKDAERVVISALRRFPGNPELRHALSQYQLRRGDFTNGWRNYEQRAPRLELMAKLDEYPEWQGEALTGKTILVCGEQGAGDQIMWARYLPLLAATGAAVVFFTQPGLARLFRESFPCIRIITSDRELAGLEPDYWAAMGSLSLLLAATNCTDRDGKSWSRGGIPDGFNTRGPYLKPAAADVDRFAAWIPANGKLRVGLCWRGNPQHRKDGHRSFPFAALQPLIAVSGVEFYSLQAGDTESGLARLVSYCHDFADTAAAIANLDVVISCDTSVLHLAGAMGKPVWGLMGEQPDWRWGATECTTPWYPSALLFRGGWVEARTTAARLAREVEAAGNSAKIARSPASPIVTGQCRYGLMSWYRNDTYIGRALDLYGEYSESEVDLFRRILNPGDVVVEAGANVGALTVALGKIVGQQGSVHAFEPQPAYAELLKVNSPPGWIVVNRVALGAESKKLALRSVPLDVTHAPGWTSEGEEFTVRQVRLDDCGLSRCNLIKIDVDGQELEILQGAEEIIGRCRPFLYVEHDKPDRYPDLLPWIHTHGYRLYQHEAPLYNPGNFAGNHVNVFGSLVSLMILAVPNENKMLHPVDWGLQRIQIS